MARAMTGSNYPGQRIPPWEGQFSERLLKSANPMIIGLSIVET